MELEAHMTETVFFSARKRAVLVTLAAVAVSAFAAHGFLFANEFFSHDSISYFTYATGSGSFYIGIGRFFIPVYECIKGDVAAPWLIGLLFILWVTLAALLVTRLLDLLSTAGRGFTGALFAVNTALTLTGATYIYCMDEYAFALCMAAAAAALFRRGKGWTALGVFLLVVSLAVYQAYFTVAACLCFLMVLREAAGKDSLKQTVLSGLRYLALLAVSFGAYYGVWTAICQISGVEKRRVEESLLAGGGLGQLLTLIRDANVSYVGGLFGTGGVLGPLMALVHALMLAVLLWRLVLILRDRELPVGKKLLLLCLVCLIPTAFNSASILLAGSATQLMTFAGELIYLLLLVCCEPAEGKTAQPWLRRLALVLLCCVLWQHIVYANQVYMKKELEHTATVSLATRVIDRVESVEGYVPGETPVAFAGRLDRNTYLNQGRNEFQALDKTVGLWSDYSATYNLGRYLTEYLNYPLLWDTETDVSQWAEVQTIPVFPATDSIQLVRGTVVVRLS